MPTKKIQKQRSKAPNNKQTNKQKKKKNQYEIEILKYYDPENDKLKQVCSSPSSKKGYKTIYNVTESFYPGDKPKYGHTYIQGTFDSSYKAQLFFYKNIYNEIKSLLDEDGIEFDENNEETIQYLKDRDDSLPKRTLNQPSNNYITWLKICEDWTEYSIIISYLEL